MESTQEAVAKMLANDPALYALLFAAYLLLFRAKSEKGKTLFIGLCLMGAPHYIYTAVFASDELMYEYDLLSFLPIIDYLRYIGVVMCGYAIISQASILKAKLEARQPAAASPASNLPPQFQRNRDHFERRMNRGRSIDESTDRALAVKREGSDRSGWGAQ